jgi:hypothetical protein
VLASKHFVTNQLTFEAQVRFDVTTSSTKSRMWHIIWIIQTQNQSAMYFTDVLAGRSALIIPFRWSVLAGRPSARDLDLAILQTPPRHAPSPFETIAPSGCNDELKASTVELTPGA